MKIEEINIAELGTSLNYRELPKFSAPIRIAILNGMLVTASTGEANIYLKANLTDVVGEPFGLVCFFEDETELKLRLLRDTSGSMKPIPFKGIIEGYLSDWTRGVGFALYKCKVIQRDE